MYWIGRTSTEPVEVPVTTRTDPTGGAVALAFATSSIEPGTTWVTGSWVGTWDPLTKKAVSTADVTAASLAAGVYWVFVKIGVGGPVLRAGQIGVY